MAYKFVDEFDYTTASLLKLFFWDNAIIDKTLFYAILNYYKFHNIRNVKILDASYNWDFIYISVFW